LIDVEDVILQRIEMIQDDDPELDAEYDILDEGRRGVITVVVDELDLPIGFEFVESDISWNRADAIADYNEVADEDFYVSVIVPNDAFFIMKELVTRSGRHGINVLTYESLGILPTPMAG
jgi:hypothetical protein